MENMISSLMIPEDMPLVKAMSVMDEGGKGIVFLCNENKLVATMTDGDIRRYILKNGDLNGPVSGVANYNFKYINQSEEAEAQKRLLQYQVKALPVLNAERVLVAVHFWDKSVVSKSADLGLKVVIQAGGKGTRLYPYTRVLPKPLIPIGDDTITELIMKRFCEYGCTEFMMIVNHKSSMIKAYFADESLDYCVDFIDENKPLGTGGGLALLKKKVMKTFFLTNCDVLIYEDYEKIYKHHIEGNYLLTMVCAAKNVTVPYGTVELDKQGKVVNLCEKPSFSFLTNTGIYIIEPEFLNYIEEETFIHITDVIQTCINRGERIGIFPISDAQWADMGQLSEMEKMYQKEGY